MDSTVCFIKDIIGFFVVQVDMQKPIQLSIGLGVA